MLPLLAALAIAAPRTSSLSWVRLDGAEACLSAPELARAVELALGRAVFVPPAEAELAVEGRAERRSDGAWQAVVRLSDTSGAPLGERIVESNAADCGELGRAATLAIALMIDPMPGDEPPPAPPAAPTTPQPPAWRVGVDASLAAGVGAVPGLGVTGLGRASLRPPRFVPLVARGEITPFARAEWDGGHLDLARATGGVQVCPATFGERVSLELCVGLDAGVLFVLGATEDMVATEYVLVQVSGSANLRWRVVGPLVLRAGLHPAVPLRPVAFAGAAGARYAPAPVNAALDVGLGLAFP